MKRLIAIVCFVIPSIAMAGLFDDDVARQRIEEVRQQVIEIEHRLAALNTIQNSQLSQATDIQQLKETVARLTGQIEVLNNQVDTLTRQQREFYNDLDARIRRLEAQSLDAVAPASASAPALGEPSSNLAEGSTSTQRGEETANFDAALRLFEAGKYTASIRAFENFLEYYPNSSLGPAAQFWIGNAYYAQQNDKSALSAYQKVIARWPSNAKSAEALLAIAQIQKDANQKANAKKTLETLIAKHPNSPSAAEAKKMISTL